MAPTNAEPENKPKHPDHTNKKVSKFALILRKIGSVIFNKKSLHVQLLRKLHVKVYRALFEIRRKRKLKENSELIRSSGLFDASWYLAQKPDLTKAEIDPVLHYLKYGSREGRDPSPSFSSSWYFHRYYDVKTHNLNPLVHYLKYGKNEGRDPAPINVLVHQMGKVGSKSVYFSLKNAFQQLGLNDSYIYHSHALNNFDRERQNALSEQEKRNPDERLAALNYGEDLRKRIDESHLRWSVISLVRDPIARNVSMFFQNLDEYFPFWRDRYTAGELKASELHDFFLSNDWVNHRLENWFDSQVKSIPAFGIDVYASGFPHQAGYQIYSGASKADLLLIRLEDLNQCAKQAINHFLGLENFVLDNSNMAVNKEYADLYRSFRNMPLPLAYIKKIYATPLARHFYSNMELELLTKQWIKGTKPKN